MESAVIAVDSRASLSLTSPITTTSGIDKMQRGKRNGTRREIGKWTGDKNESPKHVSDLRTMQFTIQIRLHGVKAAEMRMSHS